MMLNRTLNTVIAAGLEIANPFGLVLYDPATGRPTSDIPAQMSPRDIINFVRFYYDDETAFAVAALRQLTLH